MAKKPTAAAADAAPLDPAASYDVAFKRAIRVGLAIYRPSEQHTMTGAAVLAVLAAAGASEAPDSLLTATLLTTSAG